jgi:DNA-binding Lrp family transcriptional regulator
LEIDNVNARIISHLVNTPNMKSKELADILKIPLSTVQRRRAFLEREVLVKKYIIDIRSLGWRVGELFVSVEKGNSDRTAETLLSHHNVIATSVRIGDPNVNVAADIYYKDTSELHRLIEETRAMPYVKDVEWSEVVKSLEKRQEIMLTAVLG